MLAELPLQHCAPFRGAWSAARRIVWRLSRRLDNHSFVDITWPCGLMPPLQTLLQQRGAAACLLHVSGEAPADWRMQQLKRPADVDARQRTVQAHRDEPECRNLRSGGERGDVRSHGEPPRTAPPHRHMVEAGRSPLRAPLHAPRHRPPPWGGQSASGPPAASSQPGRCLPMI